MLALAIFAVTLVFVIWQPKGFGIGWSALIGAAVALATGVISPGDVPVVWHIVWDATFTFVALIIISLLLDEAGLLPLGGPAHRPLGRWVGGRLLFPLVILLGAAIAAVFANDGAALLLTPIVLAILLRLELQAGGGPGLHRRLRVRGGFDQPAAGDLEPRQHRLRELLRHLVQPLRGGDGAGEPRLARRDPRGAGAVLPARPTGNLPCRRVGGAASHAIRDPLVFRAAFPLLGLLLVAYFVTAPFGVPVSVVTCAGALILLGAREPEPGDPHSARYWRERPWQIVLFSLGMYLVVYGLKNAGLTDYLAQGLDLALGLTAPSSPPSARGSPPRSCPR